MLASGDDKLSVPTPLGIPFEFAKCKWVCLSLDGIERRELESSVQCYLGPAQHPGVFLSSSSHLMGRMLSEKAEEPVIVLQFKKRAPMDGSEKLYFFLLKN